MDLQALSGLYDLTNSDIEKTENKLKELYDFFGLPNEGSMVRDALWKKSGLEIGKCFEGNQYAIRRECKKLQKQLIYNHFVNGDNLQPLYSVIDNIFQHVTEESKLTENAGWDKAVQLARDHLYVSSIKEESDDQIYRFCQKEVKIANCIKKLQAYGFICDLVDGEVRIDENEIKKVFSDIEGHIKQLGSINVLNQIFHIIKNDYSDEFEHYFLVRKVPAVGQEVTPQVPWNLIFNLCVKQPSQLCASKNQEQDWYDLLTKATMLVGVFELQPYSQSELIFKGSDDIIEFLTEVAQYDNLFTFQQISPDHMLRITKNIFDWVDYSEKQSSGYSINEIVECIEYVLKQEKKDHTVSPLRLNKPTYKKIVNTLLTHPNGKANTEFFTLGDQSDFLFKPLLRTPDGINYLVRSSLVGQNFLEVIMSELRSQDKGLDEKLGLAIERYLKREFKNKGINSVSGKYKVDGYEGDCDLVVETLDHVIFIECKKKPLTRVSKTGHDASILLDLAGSLIHAQCQAMKHETVLRSKGELELINSDGKVYKLIHNGRSIERVCVTFFDYGALQNRMILDKVMRLIANASFSPTDGRRQKKFDELNNHALEMREYLIDLVKLEPHYEEIPFMNSWFLGLSQLMFLIDNSNSNDSFKNELWKTRHMETGSMNFLYDYKYMKFLDSHKS